MGSAVQRGFQLPGQLIPPNGPGSKGRKGPAAPKVPTIVPGAAGSLSTGG